jgi:hypothetical protein
LGDITEKAVIIPKPLYNTTSGVGKQCFGWKRKRLTTTVSLLIIDLLELASAAVSVSASAVATGASFSTLGFTLQPAGFIRLAGFRLHCPFAAKVGSAHVVYLYHHNRHAVAFVGYIFHRINPLGVKLADVQPSLPGSISTKAKLRRRVTLPV